MDQHPIPQDVTGFQFKLIGTMTVKQFGYVAAGVIMAVIIYYLPINAAWAIVLKVILVPLFGASGVIVSFVPIDGRPIDTMASNFAKALFSPNQYVYKRQGRQMSFSTVTVMKPAAIEKATQATAHGTGASKQADKKQEQLRAFLMSSQGRVKNDLDKKEASYIKTFAGVAKPPVQPTAPQQIPPPVVHKPVLAQPAPVPVPAPQLAQPNPSIAPAATTPVTSTLTAAPPPVVKPVNAEELAKREQQLAQELAQAKQEEAKPLPQPEHNAVQQKVQTLSTQIEAIHMQKQQLEQELSRLHTQLSEQKSAPVAPVAAVLTPKPVVPIQDPRLVKIVQKEATKRVEIPQVSDTPNVVVGLVKDARGNVLSNMLVEVKDKSGNPVRAFKTNPLGQFASATPLAPGVYTMEIEDPKSQHNFDLIQITANNEIMRPIEIISHDAREALRQQLFS
ncbi:MAG: PrgI family protein [Candidatus Levybacteria bacterium]|nr:PrgI family protein [Candidatus Levybacteria bacterium]